MYFDKYGTQVLDETGRVIALHEIVKLGDSAEWLGRKAGSGTNDYLFMAGNTYKVCHIYSSNGDVELQGERPEITTRAGAAEYLVQR